jgi:hypothetical protein
MEKPEAAVLADEDLEPEDSIFKRTSRWRKDTVKKPGDFETATGGDGGSLF